MEQSAIEIPRDRWREYFAEVAAHHAGWRLSVEVMSNEVGDQWAVDGMALVSCRYDEAGGSPGSVCIEAGDRAMAVLMHTIQQPVRLRAAEVVAGNELNILIESENDVRTLLTLRRRAALGHRDNAGGEATPRVAVMPRRSGAKGSRAGGKVDSN